MATFIKLRDNIIVNRDEVCSVNVPNEKVTRYKYVNGKETTIESYCIAFTYKNSKVDVFYFDSIDDAYECINSFKILCNKEII